LSVLKKLKRDRNKKETAYKTKAELKAELKPLNMSLWEYEVFVKGNNNPQNALKSAFIARNKILCETYDGKSELTDENLKTIEDYIYDNIKELKEVMGIDYVEFEVYI